LLLQLLYPRRFRLFIRLIRVHSFSQLPLRLAIFDIDGTLTATNDVDDECFLRAVSETLGVDCGAVDWSDMPHVTDSAIARFLWTRHRGRAPEQRDLHDLQRRFLTILRAELGRAPHRFAAIDGAAGIFTHLRSIGWDVAVATGGWGESTAVKLNAAGVATTSVPLACANDAESREEIVQLAWRKAEAAAGTRFERIVSVGDAAWDVRTARSLGLPFVGVGTGGVENRLRSAGATTVLPHLGDASAVVAALSSASIPEYV
jgi:phosphoglycolate phosphatase-like HAD superfamily hydrolase